MSEKSNQGGGSKQSEEVAELCKLLCDVSNCVFCCRIKHAFILLRVNVLLNKNIEHISLSGSLYQTINRVSSTAQDILNDANEHWKDHLKLKKQTRDWSNLLDTWTIDYVADCRFLTL